MVPTEPEYFDTIIGKQMLVYVLRSGDNGEDCCKNVDYSLKLKNIEHFLSLKRLMLRNDGTFINHESPFYVWSQKH